MPSATNPQPPQSDTPVDGGPTPSTASRLDAMRDVPCRVTALLGTASISVRECLALRPSSVLRLNQPAGEELEVHINNLLVARGEVLIVEEHASVRVTDIDPTARGGGDA